VLVSGEAGIGKSRITAALEERLHAEPHFRLRYFCSPYHQDSALFPFIDQLSRAAGFVRDDAPEVKLEKLKALLARAEPPDEDVAFLADLMSLPASERQPLPDSPAAQERADTGGADPATKGPGASTAGGRGRPLDRLDLCAIGVKPTS